MIHEELEVQAGIDVDKYFVESIVDHEERGWNVKNRKFRVRWSGYQPDEDSRLNWNAVKDLVLWTNLKSRSNWAEEFARKVDIQERESYFPKCCKN